MANRNYVVKKNGEIIKELKSLTGAKKIALSESADVYCGDELVFSPSDGEKKKQALWKQKPLALWKSRFMMA